MAAKEKIIRKHSILKVFILGPIVAMIVGFFFAEGIFGSLIGASIDRFCPNDIGFTGIIATIGTFIFLLIFKGWFQGEYKGSFATVNTADKKLVILIILAFVIDIAMILIGGAFLEGYAWPPMTAIGTALMAGTCEELAFRVMPISIAMRRDTDKKGITTALIISAVSFALIHCSNLLSGADPTATLIQVIATAGMAIMFGAIYLRTGNILLAMALHVIHDFLCFVTSPSNTSGIMQKMKPLDLILSVVLAVIQVVIGVILLRGHTDDIVEVWKDRWSKTE